MSFFPALIEKKLDFLKHISKYAPNYIFLENSFLLMMIRRKKAGPVIFKVRKQLLKPGICF